MSLDPTKRVPVPDNGAGMFDVGTGIGEIVQNILNGLGSILSGAVAVGSAIFDVVVQGITDFLTGIAQAIKGLLPEGSRFSEVQEAFRDGQEAITDRIDLLEGVQGYCAAFQSVNVNAEWGLNNWRDIPFKGRLGPQKNITLDTTAGQMVLGSEGLFVVYARVHARGTGFSGNDYVYLVVQCLRPDGTVYAEAHVEKFVPRNQHQTVSVAWPVVVPGPGYRIKVRTFSANWRWWDGGRRHATLHVIQHSSTAVNTGQDTVPDETQP